MLVTQLLCRRDRNFSRGWKLVVFKRCGAQLLLFVLLVAGWCHYKNPLRRSDTFTYRLNPAIRQVPDEYTQPVCKTDHTKHWLPYRSCAMVLEEALNWYFYAKLYTNST